MVMNPQQIKNDLSRLYAQQNAQHHRRQQRIGYTPPTWIPIVNTTLATIIIIVLLWFTCR